MRLLPAALMVLSLVVPAATFAQSAVPTYDCAKATGQVEQLICKDAGLIALDRKLADAYAKAIKEWPATEVTLQRATQRGWISGRNECWKETDVRACTELSYRTRIVEIQIKSGQLMAPTPVGYSCPGVTSPFTVTFYKDSVPPSAVITNGNDQVIAFAAPAASGAKYTAANVEFWEHQGEAAVSWYGKSLTCRPRTKPGA